MKYKGYVGVVELEEGSDVLFGRVIGLRDVITFQGESVAAVTQAFHDSVDDYLEFCAEQGKDPEKPYSGHFMLRLSPRLHRQLANLAVTRSISLNALVEGILESKVAPLTEQPAPASSRINVPSGRVVKVVYVPGAAKPKRPAKPTGSTAKKQQQAVAQRLAEIRATAKTGKK
jgi:predicted HicB family RNase H-like nuclease